MLPFFAIAQPPSGTYTPISGGFNWGRGYFRAFNLPLISTPALAPNQYNAYGAMVAVNTPGLAGIYYYNGADWLKLADTAYTGFASSLTSLGSGFKVLTSGIKSLLPSNGLTGDSATAGQVGIKLGGTMTAGATIIDANNAATMFWTNFNDYYVTLNSGAGREFVVSKGGSNRIVVDESNTRINSPDGASSQLNVQNGEAYFTSNTRLYLAGVASGYIYGGDSLTLGSGGTYPASASGVNIFPDRLKIFSASWQDQYSPDSVVWRLTDRSASLTFNSDGWHAWQNDGEFYFYNVARVTDSTGVDLLVWDRADQELKRMPSDLVGGGGSTNIGNTNLTLSANRSLSLDGKNLDFTDGFINSFAYNATDKTTTIGGANAFILTDDDANEVIIGGNNKVKIQDASLSGASVGDILTLKNGTGEVEWAAPAGGSNIYNTDGTLTGSRTLTRSSNNLAITNGASGAGASWNNSSASIFWTVGADNNYSAFNALQDSAFISAEGIATFIVKDSAIRIPYLPHSLVATGKMLVWDSASRNLSTRAIPSGSSGWGLTPLNTIADGDRFGTANNRSIQFWTNNTWKASLDSLGVFSVGSAPVTVGAPGVLTGSFFRGIGVDYGGLKAYIWATASANAEGVFRDAGSTERVKLNTAGDSWFTGGNVGIGTASPSEVLHVTGNVKFSGTLIPDKTITPGGTTGNQTIDKPAGTVNFATGTSTLTVTNSLVTTSSLVFAVIRTNDAAATIKNVVPGTGSFVITLNAATGAETSVGFFVVN